MKSIAFFQFSTEEDLSFVLEFSGLVLSGRDFEIKITERASNTTRATLTNGSGIAISGSNVLEVLYAKTGMAGWARGEYSADVVDVSAGGHTRIMAVRFVLDLPGRLVQGVQDRKAYINWSPNQAVVTATGAVGPTGPQGGPGNPGADGDNGWSPILAVVNDGNRRVLRVQDWTGGEGTKPAAGLYVGTSGLVVAIGDAVSIRGEAGPAGSVTDGDKGDIIVADGGLTWTVDGGYVPKTGGIFTGAVQIASNWASLKLRKASASESNQIIGLRASGTFCWVVRPGADTTDDFHIGRFSDAGAYLDAPFIINRATGVATLSNRPNFAGATPWDSANFNPASYAALTGAAFSGGVTAVRFRARTLDVYDAGAGVNLKTGRWYTSAGYTSFQVLNDAYSAALYTPITIDHSTGLFTFTPRPSFAGATPWDSANLDTFTPDTGSGGTKGLVPAPGAGDTRKLLSGSATWVLAALPAAQGRLTLTSGDSAPASVTGATTIYYTPHVGVLIPFIESGNLVVDQFSEMSLAGNAAHAVNTNYDVFYFNDGGTRRIGTGPAWSTDNSRGTGAGTAELTLLGGLPVNAVSMTVRNGSSTYTVAASAGLYLGTVRTTASAGVFDDSEGGSNTIARRFLWNAYNRVPRHIYIRETSASWSYTTGTWRRMNNNTNMQVRFVVGLAGDAIDFSGVMSCQSTSTPSNALGYDWTSGDPDPACLYGFGAAGSAYGTVSPTLRTVPSIGLHTVSALEKGNTGATFYGASAGAWNCGLNGTVMA